MKCKPWIRHSQPPKFQHFSSQCALHGLRTLELILDFFQTLQTWGGADYRRTTQETTDFHKKRVGSRRNVQNGVVPFGLSMFDPRCKKETCLYCRKTSGRPRRGCWFSQVFADVYCFSAFRKNLLRLFFRIEIASRGKIKPHKIKITSRGYFYACFKGVFLEGL